MKITTVLLLTMAITYATASESEKQIAKVTLHPESKVIETPETKSQDRDEVAFNTMMSELARVHRDVFRLPYEYEYIKGTLMPQIEAKRKIIAPHYPSREVTGDDQELIKEAFKIWYKTYPQESYDYIVYVDSFVKQHTK